MQSRVDTINIWTLILALSLITTLTAIPSLAAAPKGSSAVAPAAIELRLAMRKLWEDHITYTRNYIISALAGLPDTDAVAQRLLKNQDEIGDAIKPYYGGDAGGRLSALLRDHIMIATEVVKAAKANNTAELWGLRRSDGLRTAGTSPLF